jgi:peroxiredoxin
MPLGRREALVFGAVGVAAAAAGFLAGPLILQSRSGAADLLSARYPDRTGRVRSLSEWSGQILVCNFWATWCAPCIEEIPLLVSVREAFLRKGVEIVGIGVDSSDKIAQFTAKTPISYPVLIADASALDLLRKLGNTAGGLPYTVILNRRGAIEHRKLGAFKNTELQTLLSGMLAA